MTSSDLERRDWKGQIFSDVFELKDNTWRQQFFLPTRHALRKKTAVSAGSAGTAFRRSGSLVTLSTGGNSLQQCSVTAAATRLPKHWHAHTAAAWLRAASSKSTVYVLEAEEAPSTFSSFAAQCTEVQRSLTDVVNNNSNMVAVQGTFARTTSEDEP